MSKTSLPKTNLHAIFATDSRKEEEGTWLDVNAFQGLKIKIRRLRSDAASKEFEKKLTERYGEGKLRDLQGNNNADQGVEILKLQLSCVMIDWKGLIDTEAKVAEGEDRPEIPYSEELAMELLSIRDFREFVFQAANERDAFREKADEDAEKNLSAS